jgi:D-glutamate cyclase-like, C-terminal
MSMKQHLELSQQIENLLVARNPRGMKTIQSALKPGYYMRAAMLMAPCKGTVMIATGFPVSGTFETDGPVGAIALYQAFSMLGATPILVCGKPLASAIQGDYRVHCMSLGEKGQAEAQQILNTYQPELMISIELPGRAKDGKYYNMRGMDISDQVIFFDDMVKLAHCPTIGIGDGGNETGMGKIYDALSCLDIIPCATSCDELVIADVSNWAAHGLIAMLSILAGKNMQGEWNNRHCLEYFVERGSVDGVTGEKTLTEDGFPCKVTESVIAELEHMVEPLLR